MRVGTAVNSSKGGRAGVVVCTRQVRTQSICRVVPSYQVVLYSSQQSREESMRDENLVSLTHPPVANNHDAIHFIQHTRYHTRTAFDMAAA